MIASDSQTSREPTRSAGTRPVGLTCDIRTGLSASAATNEVSVNGIPKWVRTNHGRMDHDVSFLSTKKSSRACPIALIHRPVFAHDQGVLCKYSIEPNQAAGR